ncbi:hypothetical protein B5F08_05385 [Anaeromassilibacillus sp. An172]|nr:hypothetical protein [Anaeromassilibacillus sp. An172]OUP79219.1 hypothetical protein B5F08_05385 [Anaeromassilibacillus sp. An172]
MIMESKKIISTIIGIVAFIVGMVLIFVGRNVADIGHLIMQFVGLFILLGLLFVYNKRWTKYDVKPVKKNKK